MTLKLKSNLYVRPVNIFHSFYLRPVLAFRFCHTSLSVCVPICASILSLSICAITCDQFELSSAKFGPEVQNTLVRIPIILGVIELISWPISPPEKIHLPLEKIHDISHEYLDCFHGPDCFTVSIFCTYLDRFTIRIYSQSQPSARILIWSVEGISAFNMTLVDTFIP